MGKQSNSSQIAELMATLERQDADPGSPDPWSMCITIWSAASLEFSPHPSPKQWKLSLYNPCWELKKQ